MKNKIIIYLLFVLLVITGCSSKNNEKVEDESTGKSDFVFEEEKSVELAEKAVLHVVNKEYDDFRKLSTKEVSDALRDVVFEEVETKVLEPSGEFVELVKNKFDDLKAQDGTKYAQVLVHAKYTKAERVYTVIIDKDYKVSGFYVK